MHQSPILHSSVAGDALDKFTDFLASRDADSTRPRCPSWGTLAPKKGRSAIAYHHTRLGHLRKLMRRYTKGAPTAVSGGGSVASLRCTSAARSSSFHEMLALRSVIPFRSLAWNSFEPTRFLPHLTAPREHLENFQDRGHLGLHGVA
jgi:hypothetical protein